MQGCRSASSDVVTVIVAELNPAFPVLLVLLWSRFLPCLQKAKVHHILHLFLDTDNSPGNAIAAILNRFASYKIDLIPGSFTKLEEH